MAVAAVIGDEFVGGARFERVITVTWDAAYVAAGEALVLSELKVPDVTYVSDGVARNSSGDTFLASWDGSTTAPKLIASRTDQVDDFGEQVPATPDLSAFTSRHLVISKHRA